jgi:hypothetical protein
MAHPSGEVVGSEGRGRGLAKAGGWVVPSRTAMKPNSKLAQTVATALAAFEKMLRDGQRRRGVLLAELSLLRAKHRIIGATEDVRWLETQYIEPRETELAALDSQLKVFQEKILEVRRQSFEREPDPAPVQKVIAVPNMVWMETGSPHILALTA